MSRGQRFSASTRRRRPEGDGASAIPTSTANDDLWRRAAEEGWRILLVDHDEANYTLVCDVVAESQHIRFHLDWARTVEQALQAYDDPLNRPGLWSSASLKALL